MVGVSYMNVVDGTMVHFVSYSFPQILISSNCSDAGFYRNFMLKCKMSSEQMAGPVRTQTNVILFPPLQHIINLQVCSVKYSTFTPLQLHSFLLHTLLSAHSLHAVDSLY
jgi:hypothetical protein